jgi:hypothetical protein
MYKCVLIRMCELEMWCTFGLQVKAGVSVKVHVVCVFQVAAGVT